MPEIPAHAPLEGTHVVAYDNPERAVESTMADGTGGDGGRLIPAASYAAMPYKPLGGCYAPKHATKSGEGCTARSVKGTRLCYGHWRSAIAYAKATGALPDDEPEAGVDEAVEEVADDAD